MTRNQSLYGENQDHDDGGDRAVVNATEYRPFAEVFGSLPETVRLFGRPASPTDVLTWAVRCGFDPRTGCGEHAGCVPVEADGRAIGLTWRATE